METNDSGFIERDLVKIDHFNDITKPEQENESIASIAGIKKDIERR